MRERSITYDDIGIEINTTETIQHRISKQISFGCTYSVERMWRVDVVCGKGML